MAGFHQGCGIVVDHCNSKWENLGSNFFTMEIFIMDGFHRKIIIIIIHENGCVILRTWFHGDKWVQNIVPRGKWFKILGETWLCKVNGPKFLKKHDLGPSSLWQHGCMGKWAQVFLNMISPCSFIVQGKPWSLGNGGPYLQVPQGRHWTPIPLLQLEDLISTIIFLWPTRLKKWGQIAQEFENFLLGSVTKFPKESIGLIPIFLGEFFSLNNWLKR